MEWAEKFRDMPKDKKMLAVVTFLGIGGLIFIMISSVVPDKKSADIPEYTAVEENSGADSYRIETEKRLEEFLRSIDGAGDVKVYLTVGNDSRYIYATEGRRSKSENKTEEERKYVMIGNGSDKSALVETVETPAITGAVIACGGFDSPSVQEQIYRAVSTALGIPTGQIYVTKLKQ
ncbi:MAG: hypothetical protein NC177_06825 [Ruminococcus flavefaciens]|nr:hypothetical protein [Ruminococcus flavefaciens]